MITPGRAVCSTIRTSSRVRSISTLGMAANLYFFLMNARTLKSSSSSSRNSCLEAYQRLFQPSIMPVRNAIGFTF